MKKKIGLILVVLIIISAVVYQFIYQDHETKLAKGSMIANILVEKIEPDVAKEKLDIEIALWKQGDDVILDSEFEHILIPRSAFEFHVDDTVSQLHQMTKRQLDNFFLGKNNVSIPLKVSILEDDISITELAEKKYINYEQTLLNLTDLAGELSYETSSIVYDDKYDIELEQIATYDAHIPDSLSNAVLTYAIDKLDGQIIASDELFSFIQAVELPEKMTRSTEELSFLASAFYAASLKTNLEILLRETELYSPSYIDTGIDVYINPKQEKDFIVQNPNEFSVRLNVEKDEGSLKFAIESSPLELAYDYEVKDVREIAPRTLYRYSKKLNPGQSEVVTHGTPGYTAEVYRHIYNNGVLQDEQLISYEFSLPQPKIIVLATAIEEVIEEEPEQTDIIDEVFDELFNNEDTQEQFEYEVKRVVDEYLLNLNNVVQSEYDDYFDQFFDVLEIADSGDKEAIEKEIKRIEEQIKDENTVQTNFLYQILIEMLKESLEEQVEGEENE